MARKQRGAAARRRKAAAAKRRMAAAALAKGRTPLPTKGRSTPQLGPLLTLLPPDVLANIHDRLGFADRIAVLSVFSVFCGDAIQPAGAPWLVLPGETPEAAQLFSLADQCTAIVPATAPALRDHVFLGSSSGWLATADAKGQLYIVNPVTGKQKALPDITTMGIVQPSTNYRLFTVVMRSFMDIRLGGPPPYECNHSWASYTLTAEQMRHWFYRKVVLSASPRPVAAMLILDREFGAPVFATAEDGAWSLAPSLDGVEDAIHHKGQFYSITYTGDVEAWERDEATGKFTSTVVAPRLAVEVDGAGTSSSFRKYLAAAPDGRLMVVLKHVNTTVDDPYRYRRYGRGRWECYFKVHILGDCGGGQYWAETKDIGEAALFVGVNSSLCVPTRGQPELEADRIYFTDEEVGDAWLRKDDEAGDAWLRKDGRHDHNLGDANAWPVGVYSLKDGKMESIKALERRSFWPPPVWFPFESSRV